MAGLNLTEADGRRLAVDMLVEIKTLGIGEMNIEAEDREGRPQSDIVVRYLRTVRERDNADLEAGFMAVLTDFLGMAVENGGTDPEFYEERLDTGNQPVE